MKGHVKRQIQYKANVSVVFVSRCPPSVVFFRQTSKGGVLIDILYFWFDTRFLIERVRYLVVGQRDLYYGFIRKLRAAD